MSDFSDLGTIKELAAEVVAKVAPKVADLVRAKNAIRDKLEALIQRLAELKARQEILEDEIRELREKGADRIMEGKANQSVSAKISAKEAEHKENAGWLADLEPKAEALASEFKAARKQLLDALQSHIRPLHDETEVTMNRHLLTASRIRHSWHQAVKAAINEIGQDDTLAAGIVAPNVAFNLKVDNTKSAFASKGY